MARKKTDDDEATRRMAERMVQTCKTMLKYIEGKEPAALSGKTDELEILKLEGMFKTEKEYWRSRIDHYLKMAKK